MEAVVRILWDGRFNARSSLGILSSELTDAVTTRHSVYGVAWPKAIAPLARAFAAEFGGDTRARLTLKSVGDPPHAFADAPNLVCVGGY